MSIYYINPSVYNTPSINSGVLTMMDLCGKVFGRWTVVKEAERKRNTRYWHCKCECGTEKAVYQGTLVNGRSPSCGCISKERMTNHGLYKSKEFKVWSGMISRCKNESQVSYPNYGGRGITVCDRWAKSFSAFISDMGMRPDGNYEIDRIDGDGNYEPSNCRWATPSENSQNRRSFSKSGYKGVWVLKSGKYRASITASGKRKYLGVYKTPEESV